MPVYEYKCGACGAVETTVCPADSRDRMVGLGCLNCQPGRMKRMYDFHPAPVMHSHWNVSVGREISDMAQFRDAAKRVNERSEARTGIPSNAEPTDLMDLRPDGL